MQNNGTAALTKPEVSQVSPLIEGDYWFDSEPGAVLIRMHVPLSPAQMVAVLYYETVACGDPTIWGPVAMVLAAGGMTEIERRESDLNRELAEGREDATFLAPGPGTSVRGDRREVPRRPQAAHVPQGTAPGHSRGCPVSVPLQTSSGRDEQRGNIERWNATLTSWGVRDKSADDLPPLYGDSDLPYDPAAMGGRK